MNTRKLTTLIGLALVATFALTGCGPSAQPSASPTPTSSNQFPAGDTINDGKGDYQLARVADDDPINTVNRNVLHIKQSAFTENDVQQAQDMVGDYISEAIDSPMRFPDYRSAVLADHTPAMNKIESDYEKRLLTKYFAKGYMIDDASTPGTAPYRHPGMSITDAQFSGSSTVDESSDAFSYDYGTDKQRITARTITVQDVTARTPVSIDRLGNLAPMAPMVDLGPVLDLKVDVVYTVHALMNGKPIDVHNHSVFRVSEVKQDGKFVISDVSVEEYKP